MKSISYTKKGPGRQTTTRFYKVSNKLGKKQIKHKVGLKNAVVSLVQAHFDEKSKERFLATHI